jgi:predicted PurR-regulated permease PerM
MLIENNTALQEEKLLQKRHIVFCTHKKLPDTRGKVNLFVSINISIRILAIIAIVAAMYWAHAFFVPLLIGILASYTLSPVVDFLNKYHISRAIGAALVLLILIGGLSWLALSLSSEATTLIEKLPAATRDLRQHLSDIRPHSMSTLQNMQEAANQIEGAAADASIKPEPEAASNHSSEQTAWLHDFAIKQSILLLSVISEAPIILLLTYFLLASGEHFRRKFVQFVGPALTRKKDAVRMLDEIDIQIQRYLLSMLVASSLVGVLTWLAFKILGMEQAGIWGVIAGLLQFIPYLGPAITALTSGIASFLQYGSLSEALVTSSISLLISSAIGLAFTTWLQSRFAHVNAAVLFIALLFFAWLWGVWGLLLGAPLVAVIKVICDRVDSLKSFGELLER